MKRSLICGLALLAVLATVPARALSVYVPLAVDFTEEGVQYTTQLWLTNRGADERRFETFFIPTDADGTDRDGVDPTSTLVDAGDTVFVQSVTGGEATGVLEISGAPQFLAKAELASFIDGERAATVEVPVLTADRAVGAGTTANLLPWERSDSVRTDFGLVNLSRELTQCTVDLLGPDSESLIPTALITVPPLSQRGYVDVLGGIGMDSLTAARATVTCDQPFFTFLLQRDVATGGLHLIEPAGEVGNGFGDETPPPPPPTCTQGAVCFERSGTFHRPTPADPVERLRFPVPAGNYSSIRVQMDFLHGGWFAGNPSGLHNIFWMVRSARNRDMYGYLNFWGPNRNQVLFRHGINVPQHLKARLVAPAALVPGQLYHVDLLYQVNPGRIEIAVTGPGGVEVVRFLSAPNVDNINFGPGDDITMDFGFIEGGNPAEPPTYGWEYRDLSIEVR